jgi:acyl-CoA synthetase (NDP forming)
LGVARVDSLEEMMEALKVLHVLGPLNGGRIGAMSTSGGDLTLLADAMGPKLSMPQLSDKVADLVRSSMHERVVPANPLDFQMFTWNDEEQYAEDFTAFLTEDFDISLCLLDYPREDICDQSTWSGAERGFVRAANNTNTKGAILATFSDTITESVAERLMEDGVALLAGINTGIAAVQAAVDVGEVWKRPKALPLLTGFEQKQDSLVKVKDEAASKQLLAQAGVPIPDSRVVQNNEEAIKAAEELGYPVVAKALGVAHKTDVGGVRINLKNSNEVSAAILDMSGLSKSFLIERMVEGVIAELIVGVVRDEQFGPYLLVGGGGILVELMKDSAILLLPTNRKLVLETLGKLKIAPLLKGFRGAPPADLNAAADVIMAIAELVEKDTSSILELDVNPLMLLADGQGVVAADALISLNTK